MAKKSRFPHLTWRLIPGLQQLQKNSRQTSPHIPRLRAVWTVSYPIALAIHRLPLSRQGSPPCRPALTPFRHRHVQMCLPYVGRQESGNPLIVLVMGPYNLKGGECDGFDACGCLRLHWLVRLLITCRVELHCFAWSFVLHVNVRSFLVSYQAVVVLRCICWCVLVFLVE